MSNRADNMFQFSGRRTSPSLLPIEENCAKPLKQEIAIITPFDLREAAKTNFQFISCPGFGKVAILHEYALSNQIDEYPVKRFSVSRLGRQWQHVPLSCNDGRRDSDLFRATMFPTHIIQFEAGPM